jgi:DNA repair protein RadC
MRPTRNLTTAVCTPLYTIRTFEVKLSPRRKVRKVTCPTDAVEILSAVFKTLDADREHLAVLGLGPSGQVLGFKTVASGGMDRCSADVRAILRSALLLGATSIILAHNHPDGDTRPSQHDLLMTRAVILGAAAVDIHVRDHIVLGHRGQYRSMKASGDLEGFS